MALTTMAASPWAPLVAIAGHHQILLYHTETAQLLGVLPTPDEIAHVLRFSRNGELLLAGGGHAAKSGASNSSTSRQDETCSKSATNWTPPWRPT